jgi:hypothetical protein
MNDENQDLMNKYTKKNGTLHKQRYMNELLKRFYVKYPKIYLYKAWVDTLLGQDVRIIDDEICIMDQRDDEYSVDSERLCTCKSYYMEVKRLKSKYVKSYQT